MRVLPRDALKIALTRYTETASKGKSSGIMVFGTVEGLRELLKEWRIQFTDLGNDPPATLEANTVTIGMLDDLGKLPRGNTSAALRRMAAKEPPITANRLRNVAPKRRG